MVPATIWAMLAADDAVLCLHNLPSLRSEMREDRELLGPAAAKAVIRPFLQMAEQLKLCITDAVNEPASWRLDIQDIEEINLRIVPRNANPGWPDARTTHDRDPRQLTGYRIVLDLPSRF